MSTRLRKMNFYRLPSGNHLMLKQGVGLYGHEAAVISCSPAAYLARYASPSVFDARLRLGGAPPRFAWSATAPDAAPGSESFALYFVGHLYGEQLAFETCQFDPRDLGASPNWTDPFTD